MTLQVKPYRRDREGDIQWLTVPSEHSDLAGLESSRRSFWGSAAVKQLGLTLVPTLAHGDIYAEDGDLRQLEQEVGVLVGYVSQLSDVTERRYWLFRLSNVQAAIRVAAQHGGGVYLG